ncbi:hypothetical protein Pla163_17960 [Planctomycetes bacterium Pla163]|uniref:Tricorn protease homolog n=1 Tax=Rohdeia mirabilis TaxID=2528008 RepID=A0A518CZL8_9BACT|nr:hypothetical protein Pla163_17960 [Planctomycetes bacterium Pla163]
MLRHSAAVVLFTLFAAVLVHPRSVFAANAPGGAAVLATVDGAPAFPQYPSLSPDGAWTVFSSGGDLWAVEARGGRAQRLTAHPALELRSAFSPSGDRLAFESDRNGALQLFVAAVTIDDGRFAIGAPQQVTEGDRAKRLGGFSADGAELLFTTSHEPDAYRGSKIYRAPSEGGPMTLTFPAYGAQPQALPDGSGFVFTRGRGTPERPNYRGSGNSSLWRYDVASETYWPLVPSIGSDHEGHATPDGTLVFLSTRDGQNDLWLSSVDGDLRQVYAPRATDEEITQGHGLRDLCVSWDGTTAIACLWDRLVVVDLRSGEARPLDVRVAAIDESDAERIEDASVSQAVLSPDNATMAAIARGELYVRAVAEGRPTRRITHDAGRQSDPAWAPDGSALYFVGDDGDGYVLWRATVRTTREDVDPQPEPEAEDEEADGSAEDEAADEDESEPADEPTEVPASADEPATEESGLEAAADDSDDADAEDEEEEEKIDHGARWEGALEFDLEEVYRSRATLADPVIAPNGKRLVISEERGDLVLIDLADGGSRTLLPSWNQADASWLADSRHLVLSVSDLDFNEDVHILDVDGDAGPINVTRHPDLDVSPAISADGKVLAWCSDSYGVNWEFDVYMVYLDRDLEALQDWQLAEHFEKAKKKVKAPKSGDEVEPLELDLEESWLRARRMTSFPGSEGSTLVSPSGDTILFSGSVDGDDGVWSMKYDGSDRKRVISGRVSDLRLSLDGTKLTWVSGGSAKYCGIGGGSSETVGFDTRQRIDVAAEQEQKWREATHVLGERFYHPTLKGLDWDGLTRRYGSLAARVTTSQAFNRIGNLMFGELDGSHLSMSGGSSYSGPSDRTGYLGIELEPVVGGYRITRVLPGSPAAGGPRALAVGDTLTAVEGEGFGPADALPERDWRAAMKERGGDEVLFDVTRGDGTEERVLIRTTSIGAIVGLRYDDEIRQRRAMVEERSGGRLGYLHIRGMSMPSVRDFERDLYAAAAGKEGLVIDVRDNGGGSTTDILLASLTAPNHAFTVPRGADYDSVPRDAYPRDRRLIYGYSKPIIVLINENSFSNAEIFAHSIRNTKRGRLVGEATFGGVISTGGTTLIDGTRVRLPFRGWYLPDERDMENNGAQPDVFVPRLPGDEHAGVDAQLERAVSELVGELDE